MRPDRFGAVIIVAGGLVLVACGDDETKSTTLTASAGPGGSSTGGEGGGGTSSAGGAGGEIIIPDTSCDDATVNGVEIYAAGSEIHLEQLVSVGSRWVASGFEGYVLFDRDGQNADAAPMVLAPSWNVIGSEGSAFGVVASTAFALQYQRLDENGAAIIGPRGLSVQVPIIGVTHATDASNTLVAWGFGTRLQARGVRADGAVASPAFDLVLGAFSSLLFLRSAARDGEHLVVWTGDETLGVPETFAVRASLTGVLEERTSIYASGNEHSLVDVVATDEGYIVLLTGEPPEFTPVLLRLDAEAQVVGTALLEGARFAHGMASHGDTIAVVAGRESGEVQARAFDGQLAPLGSWVCVGSAYNDAFPPAVAPDDSGYATLFTTADGAVILHRLDTLIQ